MFYTKNKNRDISKNIHRLSGQNYPAEPEEIVTGILGIILNDLRQKTEFEIEACKGFWQTFARVSCNLDQGLSYLELRKRGERFELRTNFCFVKEVCYKTRLTRTQEELIPKGLKRLLNIVKDLDGKIKFNTDLIDEI